MKKQISKEKTLSIFEISHKKDCAKRSECTIFRNIMTSLEENNTEEVIKVIKNYSKLSDEKAEWVISEAVKNLKNKCPILKNYSIWRQKNV